MRKYTEKIHAERLIKMMERPNPCICCPAAPYYNGSKSVDELWANQEPCSICCEFLKYDWWWYSPFSAICPCSHLGKETAIKRTWITLEEKGYLG